MIHIFTTVVNRPDFVRIQKTLFDKFLLDEYQFHVVDDSIDDTISNKFKEICLENNIKYYKKTEKFIGHDASKACAVAIQWTFDELLKKNHSTDIVFLCDSDMFLVDKFSIADYMKDVIIAGLPQWREHIKYVWNGIMFFDMKKITDLDDNLNFDCGYVDGVLTDVGGHMYYYFKKNNIDMKETDVEYPTHFNDIELQNGEVTKGYNFELHLDGKFLHYRAATNWYANWRGSDDPLEKKTQIFNTILKNILENDGQ